MHVQRLVRRDLRDREPGVAPGRHEIRRYRPDRDRAQVVVIGEALAAAAAGPEPRVAGLLAELEGRPGRAVVGWLARPRRAAGAGDCPAVGLVTLVESRSACGDARWSIGWLLVRPDARRCGVGRALVAAAVGHARAAGATDVWVETDGRWPDAPAFWRAAGFEPA